MAIIAMASLFISGCSESNFDLSPDSRLPKWLSVPNGLSRDQIRVTLDYYVYPSGRKATIKIYKKDGFLKISEVTGDVAGSEPFEINQGDHGKNAHYPMYELITVGGVSEVIEHRKPESVFYVSDDQVIINKVKERK